MLSAAEAAVLTAFKGALQARFGDRLKSIVLFGSRARGEGHEASDLDVLVLVAGVTKQERREIIDVAFDRELAEGLVISPLIRDPLVPQSLGAGLASEIARDGVPL